MNTELAKKIISENSKIRYGIFGVIETSGYFPPHNLLNQFFEAGNDPCDQDGRMEHWKPFALNEEEYLLVCNWWMSHHPGAVVNDFGASKWSDWSFEVIESC